MKEDRRTLHIDTPFEVKRRKLSSPFAQFAEPMTAALADLCELTRPPSAFAAFQGHFFIRLAQNAVGSFMVSSNQGISANVSSGLSIKR